MPADQLEVLVSGPTNGRPGAEATLRRAGIRDEHFVKPEHGLERRHAGRAGEWLAFRLPVANADDQAEALAKVAGIEQHGWALRIHRPIRPTPPAGPQLDVFAELAQLKARLAALEGGQPPMAGGALESPAWIIGADQHPAYLFRQMPQSLLSGTGVVGSGDLLVSANSPTAMNVLVAAGQAWLPGTQGGAGFGSNAGAQSSVGNTNGGSSTSTGYPASFTVQGSYYCLNDAQVVLSIASADPTNPRIDLICASVQDASYSGTSNQAVLQVITGTAGASPAPPAPPANSVILSSVWVPAAATSIVAGNLNDLRPIARSGAGQTGHTNIATSQSTSSTTYTTLATADQVTGIVLPANGLIRVWYQATWQESVQGAARAAIFLGSNQLKIATSRSNNPNTEAAAINISTLNVNQALATCSLGLGSGANINTYGGDVTTGQAVGVGDTITYDESGSIFTANGMVGGPCDIFAAAGTYTVSVQFRASSGSVTASNRKLWVQALAFS